MRGSFKSDAVTPTRAWRLVRRGLWIAPAEGGVDLYVERTRDGWAYGTSVKAAGTRTYEMHDEVTRPINRAKVLAERLAGGRA